MSKTIFISRILGLVIILSSLFYFNVKAQDYQDIVEQNELINLAAQEKTEGKYKDGSYQGTGQGYGGPITVEVVVVDGHIQGLSIVSADREDAAYYNMAIAVVDKIIKANGPEVDGVSGATFTSNGIKKGVQDALSMAAI